ncbi:MAG: glycoside hydrolase family 31 protein [Opitutales bacterium]|nr:glycoside hydrolase family 31 protein [Opitutales bacterium]
MITTIRPILLAYWLFFLFLGRGVNARETHLELLPGEYWWGGLSVDGIEMPYDRSSQIERDLMDNRGNQSQPLLISSKGRYIWCEQPFTYKFVDGYLSIRSDYANIDHGQVGESLREVFAFVSKKYFPSSGRLPEAILFTAPQYNTWIELMYDQNESDILKYASSILKHDFPPGVIMIDDNWQQDYGNWKFAAERFSDPKRMIEILKGQGFKIMLWVCPFVSPDSDNFRFLSRNNALHLDPNRKDELKWGNAYHQAAVVDWWNGSSALLDLSSAFAKNWFYQQLDKLVNEYDVDGFKLDAGDSQYYRNVEAEQTHLIPVDHTMLFASIGLRYPLNEYRACWKMGGQALVQRLRDKSHSWEDLKELIPGIIAQGLMGYAFTCPDMIGGGEFQSFLSAETIDPELIVRSAQVHALMPMMQFSVAPWRVLDNRHLSFCQKMAQLHSDFGAQILEIAEKSAQTGEPMIKPLAWFWPEYSYETIHDQFILGEDLMVAPVLVQGARSRKIIVPPGKWKGDDDSILVGPAVTTIEVPLERLPYFKKMD